MEIKKRQIEETYYVAFDGKEFTNQIECEHYEAMQKGVIKTCTVCNGTGEVTRNNYGVDLLWGSMKGVKYWNEKCEECNGKGYIIESN